MSTTLGQLKEFNPDSDLFSAYVERVNIFFTVNDISGDKRAAVFLNFIGARAYELLRSLLTPTLPQTLKYSELVNLLREHYDPHPVVIAERFHFHRRNQREGESIAEFMAELRRLSTHCDFKSYLNEALRDRLVCGLRSESTQRRLLAEKDLSLQKAMEIAQGMEAADRNTKSLKGSTPAIHKVRSLPTAPKHKSPNKNQRSIHERRVTVVVDQTTIRRTAGLGMPLVTTARKRDISHPPAAPRKTLLEKLLQGSQPERTSWAPMLSSLTRS